MEKVMDWIVIAGQLIDSVNGGGYEFFGPFTETEAKEVRENLLDPDREERMVMAVQLLGVFRRRFDQK